MRREAKASSFGSAVPSYGDGRGFSNSTRGIAPRSLGAVWILVLVVMVFAFAPAAHASKSVIGYFGDVEGTQPGQLNFPHGLAVNSLGIGPGADPGDLYVADTNRPVGETTVGRIQQFGQLGNFIREWGWDIVQSGPDDTGANEQQTVEVPSTVTAGTYKLKVTVATSNNAPSYDPDNPNVITGVSAATGAFRVGDQVEATNGAVPAGTTITAVGSDTLTLSAAVSSGFFGATLIDYEVTTPIRWNAPASGSESVQEKLEELPDLGPGNISVSGGPGASGTPFTITFAGGPLAHDDVAPIVALSLLTGGTATVATVTNGGGFEVCDPADHPADVCKNAAIPPGEAAPGGALNNPGPVALDSGPAGSGQVFVSESGGGRGGWHLIDAYGSDGQFEASFGWGVTVSGPDRNGEPQSLVVEGTSGTYTLAFEGQITAPIPYFASASTVEAELNALSTIGGAGGSVTVSGGPGDNFGSNPYLIEFGGSLAGTNPPAISSDASQMDDQNVLGGKGAAQIRGGFTACVPANGDVCQSGAQGRLAGQLTSPESMAVDPTTGDLYVVNDRRVEQYGIERDSSGAVTGVNLVSAYGSNVVASGPDNGPPGVNAEQSLTVSATGGTFALTLFDQTTGWTGAGALAPNSTTITDFTTNGGIPSRGEELSGPGIRPNTTINNVSGTTITLSQETEASASGRQELEADLPFDVSAGHLREALERLSAIGAGSVGVSGGGGDATGSTPYLIEFIGALAKKPIPLVESDGSGLTGGSPSSAAVVANVIVGSREFEVCKPGVDICQEGARNVGEIAIGSNGVIYLESEGRAETLTPSPSTPPYTSYAPADFDPADFTSLGGLVLGPGDHVLGAKRFEEGASACPDGSQSVQEYRLIETDSSGTTPPLDTHLTCSGIEYFNNFVGNTETGTFYTYAGQFKEKGSFFNTQRRALYIVDNANQPTATIDSVTPNTSGATVTGTINPEGADPDIPHTPSASYQLEYREAGDPSWTPFGVPVAIGAGFADHAVTVHLGGLPANTSYELRLVASKPGVENDYTPPQAFNTLATPPTIDALSSSGITATSIDLTASINAHGTDTTYHFEYGKTPDYGQRTPEASVGNSLQPQSVKQHVEGLEPSVYHFRVVAENALGKTTSADQTFTFYPPPCPNEAVRQETASAYLPDCRAYEIVSPEDAGPVVLREVPEPAPSATNPARFVFGGAYGLVPGTDATNASVDTYLATRTSTGWNTTYAGIKGDEAPTTELGAWSADLGLLLYYKVNESFYGPKQPPTQAPYIFDVNGNLRERWPSDVESIPNGDETNGIFQPSPDFSHVAISSSNVDFDPNGHGLTSAPGSAYDYHVETGETNLISKTAAGGDIPQEPGAVIETEESIEFPGDEPSFKTPADIHPSVSTDGSHILMSTRSGPPPGQFSDSSYPPVRLYMRVADAITYEVSDGHYVNYVGMTSDGSKVFFTSPEDLATDLSDTDSSTDLYMWDEQTDTINLISVGTGAGNTDSCYAAWTEKCDVQTVAGSGGGFTNYPVGTQDGDVYFYSPELLDGPENGLEGSQNLYDYHDGSNQYVATLASDGSGPIKEINVAPDGEHAAFVTTSRLTSYNGSGHSEMYAFDRATGKVTCVSCIPSGEPPEHNVEGSDERGLFMSSDGRTFFTTTDPLVAQDTDGVADVYEYVDGRPQLITSGTGETHVTTRQREVPATVLSGVSENGVNVYFGTYDTLVVQDHNGPYLKFYDARTGGGFPAPRSAQPCVAADECHGATSSAPPESPIVSGGDLGGGGNAPAVSQCAKVARGAKRSRHRAGLLRRAAEGGSATKMRPRSVRRRVRRLSERAGRLSKKAQSCRASRRRATK